LADLLDSFGLPFRRFAVEIETGSKLIVKLELGKSNLCRNRYKWNVLPRLAYSSGTLYLLNATNRFVYDNLFPVKKTNQKTDMSSA
jgi:hypothetical protein